MRLSLLFFLFIFLSAEAQQLKVPIHAKSAILINPDSGAVLFEKNADSPVFPASTTKIATAFFALEGKKIDLNAQVRISSEAVKSIHASVKQAAFERYPSYLLEHDGTTMGLKSGEVVDFNTLLHGLMLLSGNDAANAIAEHCSGSIDQFMLEMNDYLQKLGFTKTRLTNPHGLHHPMLVTTAHDFAKIAALALKNPIFRQVVGCESYESPTGATMLQYNRLLKKGSYFYPKAIGVKTGHTSIAGFNLVAAAEDNGRLLIAVVFGCENAEQRYKEAIALFEAAFKEKKVTRTLLAKESEAFSLILPKAEAPLKAQLIEDLKIEYFPAEEPKLRAEVKWKQLVLPIQIGQLVGCIKILDEEERIVMAAPLYAIRLVNKSLFYKGLDLAKWILPWSLLFLLLLIKPLRQKLEFFKGKLLGARLWRKAKRN